MFKNKDDDEKTNLLSKTSSNNAAFSSSEIKRPFSEKLKEAKLILPLTIQKTIGSEAFPTFTSHSFALYSYFNTNENKLKYFILNNKVPHVYILVNENDVIKAQADTHKNFYLPEDQQFINPNKLNEYILKLKNAESDKTSQSMDKNERVRCKEAHQAHVVKFDKSSFNAYYQERFDVSFKPMFPMSLHNPQNKTNAKDDCCSPCLIM